MLTRTIGILAVTMFVSQQPPPAQPPPQPPVQPPARTMEAPQMPLPEAVLFLTPFEVSDHHERYAGKTISMIGNVDDAFNGRAFTIDDDLPWNHSGDILVIAPEMKKEFTKVAYVRIVGRVVPFADAEVQKFLEAMPKAAGKVRDFKGRAIVVAAAVTGPDGQDLTAGGK